MKKLRPALLASVFGVLLVGMPIALWQWDHGDEWPPVDPTSRYAYCELEGQVYVKVIDRNAYVIIEPGGIRPTFEPMTERISPEYEALLREKGMARWSPDELKKHSYNLELPDFEIQIPSGEDPYRWRPDGRKSMYECYLQMRRDGSYQSTMYQLRLD